MVIAVPIPARMAHLAVDRRGYPVPVIVAKNPKGQPAFSVNDADKVSAMVRQDRCAICGRKLFRGKWLVGGGISALAWHGSFADGPVHDECVHYALKVCPYLAAPNWRSVIGPQQFAAMEFSGLAFGLEGSDLANLDPTRPEAFVAVMAAKIETQHRPGLILCRPAVGHVLRVEVWRHGKKVTGADLFDFAQRAREKVERIGQLRHDIFDLLGGG